MSIRKNTGPFATRKQLILASTSPRRRRFLERLGLDFQTAAAEVEEIPQTGEGPEQFVTRLAEEKARIVADRYPDAWVLGADTAVMADNEILGKPADQTAALDQLHRLVGGRHRVLTGFCLCCSREGYGRSRLSVTEVTFGDFSREVLAAYVDTGEPLDKAGSYGVQGMGGFLVERLDGSWSNVVGLPLTELISELLRLGVIAPR